MPRFNRKGPEGKGAMTGRGLGKCNSTENNRSRKGEGGFSAFWGLLGNRRFRKERIKAEDRDRGSLR